MFSLSNKSASHNEVLFLCPKSEWVNAISSEPDVKRANLHERRTIMGLVTWIKNWFSDGLTATVEMTDEQYSQLVAETNIRELAFYSCEYDSKFNQQVRVQDV